MLILTLPPHQLRQLVRDKPIVYAEDRYWTPPKAQEAVSPMMHHAAGAPSTSHLASWPAELLAAGLNRLFGGGTSVPGAIRYWD